MSRFVCAIDHKGWVIHEKIRTLTGYVSANLNAYGYPTKMKRARSVVAARDQRRLASAEALREKKHGHLTIPEVETRYT